MQLSTEIRKTLLFSVTNINAFQVTLVFFLATDESVIIKIITGLEISARLLAQANVKTVRRVQVTDHSLDLVRTIIISTIMMTRIYYSK